MPDYSKGKIYTIRNKNDPTLIYVGSTIQTLSKRFGEHRRHSRQERSKIKYPNHQFYNKIEDWNDWYIELYLTYPCKSVEELRQKEGEIIRQIGTLNRGIAGRTFKEWQEENPEKMKKYKEQKRNHEIEIGRYEIKMCACGGRYSQKTIREHERTKKHQNFINLNNPLDTAPLLVF